MKKFELNKYILEPKGKIAKRMVYKDSNVIVFVLNIAQGHSLPNHSHYDSTVLVEVISGQANLIANGQSVPITKTDLVQLDGPEMMQIDNTGQENLALYVTISPAPPNEDYAIDVDI